MPLTSYFLSVGGVLLMLLCLWDSHVAELSPSQRINGNPPTVRIRSDRKLPERVVFDTSIPAVVPEPSNIVPVAPVAVVAAPPAAGFREAFAEVQVDVTRTLEVKKREVVRASTRRKFSKRHRMPPTFLVTRNQQFGWFDNRFWR